MRKRESLIILLMLVTFFSLGARGRYSALWKRVSGGISYPSGNITLADGDLGVVGGGTFTGSVNIGGSFNYAVDTASDDTYLATVSGVYSYTTGMFILLNPVTDNTGACTLNINSLGAKSLKTVLGADPGDNHIDAAQIVPLCYDGTNFIILTPDSNP